MAKQFVKLFLACVVVFCLCISHLGLADESSSQPVLHNDLVENGQFIQIPGPNPVLITSSSESWDDDSIEAADA